MMHRIIRQESEFIARNDRGLIVVNSPRVEDDVILAHIKTNWDALSHEGLVDGALPDGWSAEIRKFPAKISILVRAGGSDIICLEKDGRLGYGGILINEPFLEQAEQILAMLRSILPTVVARHASIMAEARREVEERLHGEARRMIERLPKAEVPAAVS